MKNLIYILIFLPSLLFSQETKNMQFVGVRSEQVNCDNQSTETMNFNVDSGYLFKITNSKFTQQLSGAKTILYLDNEVINASIRMHLGSSMYQFLPPSYNYPIFLGEGSYELKLEYSSTFTGSATISGLEFKLTTP